MAERLRKTDIRGQDDTTHSREYVDYRNKRPEVRDQRPEVRNRFRKSSILDVELYKPRFRIQKSEVENIRSKGWRVVHGTPTTKWQTHGETRGTQ